MNAFKKITFLWAILILLAFSGQAFAATWGDTTPWQHPNELSVAGMYNNLYGTSYRTDVQGGLADLHADHGGVVSSTWNTSTFARLKVLSFDTGSNDNLYIKYGAGFSQSMLVYDPVNWNGGPSRGYEPNGPNFLNLQNILGAGTDFQLYIGNTLINNDNSIFLTGLDGKFFIGYNGGGFSQDMDFNEPLIQGAAVPLPAAVWLLGSGLLGLVGLRKKIKR